MPLSSADSYSLSNFTIHSSKCETMPVNSGTDDDDAIVVAADEASSNARRADFLYAIIILGSGGNYEGLQIS